MQFLSAASAWFAVSLPAIVLMYILKKQYENISVPSHLLWRRVMREQEANRPWQRLRSRLLLLLQLLAALIIVLALMEPAVPGSAAEDGHAVLLIDRSASMTARAGEDSAASAGAAEGGLTRLELAVRAALDWLDEQPPGRPVSVVLNGAEPSVLASRERDKELVRTLLREVAPHYGRSDNTAALSLADSLHQGEGDGVTLLFTDGNWPDAGEANGLTLHARTELSAIGGAIDNAGILSFGVQEEATRPGRYRAIVTVRNDAPEQRDIAVAFYAYKEDGTREPAAELTLQAGAGGWQSGEVRGLPPAVYYKAELRHGGDDIAADDTAYDFPAIGQERRVLLVTSGNLFLEKALLLAGVQPIRMAPGGVAPSGDQAQAIDWILLDGALEQLQADAGWSGLLEEKPLWIIDHPQTDGDSTRVPAGTGVSIEPHPVTDYLSFQDTHIGRLASPEPSETAWGKPVLEYGGVPAIYAGTDNGRPRLRFAFKLQDTDLPLRPEFPVLVVQAASWMNGSDSEQLGTAAAGARLEPALLAETAKAEWLPVESAGAGLAVERQYWHEPQPLEAYGTDAYAAPAVPGLYRLNELSSDGDLLRSRLLAVVADRDELAQRTSERELQAGKTESGGGQGSPTEPAADSAAVVSRPLIAALALLLLALVAAEWEVYRRGHTG